MDGLSQVLSRFALTFLDDTSIQEILDHLVAEAVELLPADGAGVTLFPPIATPRYLAASDATSLRFESLQGSLSEGPCLAARETRAAVTLPDLRHDTAFPRFVAAAQDMGLAGVYAFPLGQHPECLGALDLYCMSTSSLSDTDIQVAQTLANVVAAYLGRATVRADFEATAERERTAADRLQTLNSEDREFVATLTHELGSPIANIHGFTELMVELDSLSEDQRQFVAAIRRNADRLRALTNDLLTLFSLDERSARPVHTILDLRDVVTAAREGLESAAVPLPRLVFHFPEAPLLVSGAAEQLESMVANLLSNAVKYTATAGTVVCVVRQQDDEATVEIHDNGIGIPAEEQSQLFGRFFRASTARALDIDGTGLGLAIVKSIAERHGGAVTVSSRTDQGSSFVVHIPLVDESGVSARRRMGAPRE